MNNILPVYSVPAAGSPAKKAGAVPALASNVRAVKKSILTSCLNLRFSFVRERYAKNFPVCLATEY
jgi:hypothetical protein